MANRFTKIAANGKTTSTKKGTHVIVRDRTTGLEWQADQSEKKLNHKDAVAYCKSLDLLGGGWRLPTHDELRSLVDLTKHAPAIDTAAFPKTEKYWYWTSTPRAWSPSDAAWLVNFNDGNSLWNNRYDECFARAVRARQ